MIAVNWHAISVAGAFAIGTLAGSVLTVRLAKVLADFFRRERDR